MNLPVKSNSTRFQQNDWLFNVAALVVSVLGIGLRLLNLTNPPLDFHAWRQLRSATIARGMYYEMLPPAIQAEHSDEISMTDDFEILEPHLFEGLVAVTYFLTGGERLWIARLYAIIFWGIGGVVLFLLARRIFSSRGALVSLAYYLLLPYGVSASRSFQPDPVMVMWVILAAYALYRWSEERSWKWALAAGIFSGMAVLVKVFAVYCIAAMAILVVLSDQPFRKAMVNRQVWVTAGLMILIPAIYYLGMIGSTSSGYLSAWILGFQSLLTKPFFYVRWLNMLHSLLDLVAVLLGAACVTMFPRRGRFLMVGLWIGYGLIGLSVPSLVITHDYYNLVLIPIVALSLSWLGEQIIQKVGEQPRVFQYIFIGVALLAIAYPAWLARNTLVANDYREEIKGWQKMGQVLPRDGNIIAITHDYGTRLKYYGGITVTLWPYSEDQKMNVLVGGNANMNDPSWKDEFTKRTQGFDYFLVTIMGELDSQPVLKKILYDQFPYTEGDGYILFDLKPNP